MDYAEINSKLQNLKTHIFNIFNKDNTEGKNINTIWLKENINLFFNRPNNTDKDNDIFLIPFIESFIEIAKTKLTSKGKPLAKNTIKHYNTTLNKLKDYEKAKNVRLKLININLNFHDDFVNYCHNEYVINPNSIGGYIDDIKFFCRNAEAKGLVVCSEYKSRDFFSPSNKTHDIYVTEEEINKIFEFDFAKSERLDNVRDWFIIGVWTGLRISDFLNLTKNDIDKDRFLVKKMQKTDYPVILPLHKQVEYILAKRKGEFPRQISDQKFNEYIKEVCQKVGLIDIIEGSKRMEIKTPDGKKVFRKIFGKYPKFELVSSHTCRRSFATNLYGKLDTLTIMKVIGHQTEKQLLDYIKITPKEYAIKLKALWKE